MLYKISRKRNNLLWCYYMLVLLVYIFKNNSDRHSGIGTESLPLTYYYYSSEYVYIILFILKLRFKMNAAIEKKK